MSKGRSLNFQTAYVVVRIDDLTFEHPLETTQSDGPAILAGKYEITIKEVVLSLEEAQHETQRLNTINADKKCRYFWQSTHLFLDGGSHGSLEK